MRKTLMATLVVVLGVLAFGGNALASSGSSSSTNLYRFFPEGIPSNDEFAAFAAVNSRASVDQEYASAIARQAGESRFVAKNYRPVGFSDRVPAGTLNSASNSRGAVVRVKDRPGDTFRMLIVLNVRTQKTVYIMVRCGNPRLGKQTGYPQVPWKPFVAEAVLKVNKSVTKTKTITCPSGQRVTAKMTVRVTGVIRARSWGQVKGSLKNYVQSKADLQIVAKLQLRCGEVPGQASARLSKLAYSDGRLVVLNGGEFAFNVWVNGQSRGQVRNAPSGDVAELGGFKPSDVVRVCETQMAGYKPDQECIEHTMLANENYTFKFINRKRTPTCEEQGNCPQPPPPPSPKTYSASGSTSVQDQKVLYAPCPPPNQSITKSGSSDLKTRSSGNFTETSNVSQADAQRKLDDRLAAWRSANQPIVNDEAQTQAQERLNAALLTCPAPPPAPVGCSASPKLEKDGRTVNLSVNVSGPVVSTSIAWGDGATSSGNSAGHFYTADGSWTIIVTVTGDKGQTATCTAQVTTKADSGPPPPP